MVHCLRRGSVYGMTGEVCEVGDGDRKSVDFWSLSRRLLGRKGRARAARGGGPTMGSSRSSGFLLSRGLV